MGGEGGGTMQAEAVDEAALVVQEGLLEEHATAGQLSGGQHQDLQSKMSQSWI